MEPIEKIKSEIIRRLKPLDPEKIIIFGSYAWGTPDENSDIDICVVTKDDFIPANWAEKNRIHLKIASGLQDFLQEHPADLIVQTRTMHRTFLESGSNLSRKIQHDGLVIYE